MKNLKTILFLTVFTTFGLSTLPAQSSPLIGSWDLTITMDDDQLENLGMFRHGLMASDGFPDGLKLNYQAFQHLSDIMLVMKVVPDQLPKFIMMPKRIHTTLRFLLNGWISMISILNSP